MDFSFSSIDVDFTFHFYTSFQYGGNEVLNSDYQIVISNTDFDNIPDSIEEQYEFIIIDCQCNRAENILINNENKLIKFHWILLDMQPSDVRMYVSYKIRLM